MRIVLLGDSQTEGLQVRFDETYGSVLQRDLERLLPGRRFEVVNLAVSAYGTHQEVLTLKRYGSRIQPDWVVLGFYPGNDLSDNVRWPLIAEDASGGVRLVSHHFSLSHRVTLGTKIWMASVSHAYTFFAPRLKEVLSVPWLAKIGLIEPVRPSISPSQVASGSGPPRAYRITDELIRMARAEARQLDAEFAVLTIPSKTQVLQPGSVSGADDMDRLESDFVSSFEGGEILHLEALAPLRQSQQGGAAPYFRLDGHLNAIGHRVVGEMLARWLAPRLLESGRPLSPGEVPRRPRRDASAPAQSVEERTRTK